MNARHTIAFVLTVLITCAPAFYSGNQLLARNIKKNSPAKKTAAKRAVSPRRISNTVSISLSKSMLAEADEMYEDMQLDSIGLKKNVFEYAYKGYQFLLNQHQIAKSNVLTIVDFSQSSRNRRMYVVDLETRQILVNTFVAHGRKSGGEFANSFSNKNSSHKSSLGFYITQDTYDGKNGYSLRLRGLEKGFNDKAGPRAIVLHGSDYIGEDFIKMNAFCGRSFGCPAVPAADVNDVIGHTRGGTCLFIYHPTKKYLKGSKILNS